ncbi:hypothetical protein K9U39_03605 [Rhodoblastus acidophilus]|uniref:Uncharacterized protein n=1 Tax=Candidatus Rhodoblastus alkanivorans TaxID=2954117 RepID=A0ABS9Z539_9HYPH|nr:hypothetical protein [Candidatus Rhodoblastus alkanivorans]MCI4679861.1 hypothetical protein [Candidatus Rhodoblastus alkanivorans]MCI4682736.1 hypothetical protein [Candidatus Rhodoblastus alkanivorans]MDI4640043.1 hypothetical protein [Rhodoblastus acidophilus]
MIQHVSTRIAVHYDWLVSEWPSFGHGQEGVVPASGVAGEIASDVAEHIDVHCAKFGDIDAQRVIAADGVAGNVPSGVAIHIDIDEIGRRRA